MKGRDIKHIMSHPGKGAGRCPGRSPAPVNWDPRCTVSALRQGVRLPVAPVPPRTCPPRCRKSTKVSDLCGRRRPGFARGWCRHERIRRSRVPKRTAELPMNRATPIRFGPRSPGPGGPVVQVRIAPGPGGDQINAGDVAWMLTASGLVFLMTPGLSFFYGGMVRPEERRLDHAPELRRDGGHQPAVGRRRLQPRVRRRASAAAGSGDPRTFFMFTRARWDVAALGSDPDRPDHPAGRLRDVPAEVRHHHAGADHRERSPSACGSRPTCCSSACSAC